MRRIGTLSDEAQARRFRNYLLTRRVDSVIDTDSDPTVWEVWIRNEDDLQVAREEFVRFQASPDDEQFAVDDQAEQIRKEKVEQVWLQRQQVADSIAREPSSGEPSSGEPDHGDSVLQQNSGGNSNPEISADSGEPLDDLNPLLDSETQQIGFPVTIAIIVLSVIASFSCNFAEPRGSRIPGKVTLEQQISFELSFVDSRDYEPNEDSFASLAKGELWRVITPMFLHGNMLHLFFNMFKFTVHCFSCFSS